MIERRITVDHTTLYREISGSSAALLCSNGGYDQNSALYSAPMRMPRPAKLLLTVDDCWNRYLEKHGAA